jgi:hypothetical protein
MHRKFIALIVSAALAVTGLSLAAAPARADDTAKILAGIAAFALIGAAIHNNRNKDQVVIRPGPTWQGPGHTGTHYRPQPPIQSRPTPPAPTRPRPLPPRYTRYDLPNHCLKPANGFRQGKYLVGNDCLERYYGSTSTLPGECRVRFGAGRETRTMFRPGCLQKHGYRLVRR